jgi:molybdopterin molybdotransferase
MGLADTRQPHRAAAVRRTETKLVITEEDALAHILDKVAPLPSRILPLARAREEFAARDIFAKLALPVFDNSAMDGYAVVAGASGVGKGQRVIGEQPAGVDRGLVIAPGEAIRIFTGAPLPAGADAVVMQEDVRHDGSEIFIETEVAPGDFVRRRGSDLSEGQKIVEMGDRVRPQTLALLAAQGFAEIEVGGAVRAALIITGDELIPPGGSLGPGQIYESNSILVQALVEKCGVADIRVEHCPDDAKAIEAALRRCLEYDVLVVVGGVSVGARDLVKPALSAVGAQTDLWRVSVKPGKPFLFGRAGGCAIFGLPGNPVSAFITFLLFVRPAIVRLRGARLDDLALPTMDATLAEEVQNDSDRPHYVRGQLLRGRFNVIGRQESHALYGLSRANALLRVPAREVFRSGSVVPVLSLD